MPPEGSAGRSYRDDLSSAYKRIADLESKNRELERTLACHELNSKDDHARDLDATLARWDRVRATLAMLLGFTGLFALRIADRWSVRVALLSTCAAMVMVGIILAWPNVVRARMDPKPWALDVTPWGRRRRKKKPLAAGQPAVALRVEVEGDEPRPRVDVSDAPDAEVASAGAAVGGRPRD